MITLPRLALIPPGAYTDYRYEVIFGAYKWDPQVRDANTVSRHAAVITRETAQELNTMAERLSAEVMAMEEALLTRPELQKTMGFGGKMKKPLRAMGNYRREEHVRLMRFDFHPTEDGWMISEVNSDVPGGLAEAAALPQIAARYLSNGTTGIHATGESALGVLTPGENPAEHLLRSFQKKLAPGSRIAFVHATSYADDRQVMQFLSDHFQANGFRTLFAAPDHLRFNDGKAYSVLAGAEGPVDGIARFFPLEWLENLPRGSGWQGYFDCAIPCCNHPAAVLTQSKRLPLVWDKLGLGLPAWKALLPETCEPKAIAKGQEGFIYKPAFGRVGAGISIKGAIPEKERKKIERAARRQKRLWAAQRMFRSVPTASAGGEPFHMCLGVFTVDGKAAGFYARISETLRIDEHAQDIPVLIEESDA